MDVVQDEQWFRYDFTPTVAGRGEPVGICTWNCAAGCQKTPNSDDSGASCYRRISCNILHRYWDEPGLMHKLLTKIKPAGGEIASRLERSPAASTAVAVADAVKSLVEPTAEGECFSSAVCTDGNPYGIREGLICSMPCWSQVASPLTPLLSRGRLRFVTAHPRASHSLSNMSAGATQ